MTAATTTGLGPGRSVSPTRFTATLASEWTKLVSLRSTYIIVALGIGLSIATTALLSLVVGVTWDDWDAAARADFDPSLYSLSGLILGGIVFSVLGVLIVASEYASGMIRLTLTATPRRGRVLAAKVILITAVMLVAGPVTLVGMFLAAQAIFGAYDLETASLGDRDTLRMVVGMGAMSPLFPVVGAALGVLLRSTAGAITTVLAIIWLPEIIGPFLPSWWQENVIALLPGRAADSVGFAHLENGTTYLDPGVGIVVVAAWLIAFIGAAYILLVRRDA